MAWVDGDRYKWGAIKCENGVIVITCWNDKISISTNKNTEPVLRVNRPEPPIKIIKQQIIK